MLAAAVPVAVTTVSYIAVGATTLVSHSEAHTIQESFLRFEAKNFSGYYMYLGN